MRLPDMTAIDQPEYTKLANIYDSVMEDVNYDLWGDFIDAIIREHYPGAKNVLELACGTGSLSLSLDELDSYNITATDKSDAMIEQARRKNKEGLCNVLFRVMDFLNIEPDQTYDIVVSIFDSINYLQTPEQIQQFLKETQKVLHPQSLLIFDFTTPKNSIRAIEYLNNEEGYTPDNYRFFRKSTYDPSTQIHKNEFKIEKLSADQEGVVEQFREVHKQKIYTLPQMLDIIDQSEYRIVAKYGDFDMSDANEKSLRITMVLQCPNIR